MTVEDVAKTIADALAAYDFEGTGIVAIDLEADDQFTIVLEGGTVLLMTIGPIFVPA